MPDQVIEAAMARALYADACRDHPLVTWVIWYDHPAPPGRFIAQLATRPLSYILIGDTLAKVQAQLPPGSERWDRQPFHPPEVVEIWFAQ
jgi:hypothetical protein